MIAGSETGNGLASSLTEAGPRLTGHVGISTTGSGRTGDRALSGDYFRLDRPRRMLAGGAFVASDPGRVPPELCTAWDVRLLNGGAFAGETEYVFYVPGWGSPGDRPLVGRVYTEGGEFVQTVVVEPAGQEAFRRTAEELQLRFADVVVLLVGHQLDLVALLLALHAQEDRYHRPQRDEEHDGAADHPEGRRTRVDVVLRIVHDGFVRRYRTRPDVDGLPAGEGAFLACTFWLADNLGLLGRTADARAIFERLLGLANDVGLLSEQYDPVARRLLGNFPQAFTHVSLVNTACNLAGLPGPADRRRS